MTDEEFSPANGNDNKDDTFLMMLAKFIEHEEKNKEMMNSIKSMESIKGKKVRKLCDNDRNTKRRITNNTITDPNTDPNTGANLAHNSDNQQSVPDLHTLTLTPLNDVKFNNMRNRGPIFLPSINQDGILCNADRSVVVIIPNSITNIIPESVKDIMTLDLDHNTKYGLGTGGGLSPKGSRYKSKENILSIINDKAVIYPNIRNRIEHRNLENIAELEKYDIRKFINNDYLIYYAICSIPQNSESNINYISSLSMIAGYARHNKLGMYKNFYNEITSIYDLSNHIWDNITTSNIFGMTASNYMRCEFNPGENIIHTIRSINLMRFKNVIKKCFDKIIICVNSTLDPDVDKIVTLACHICNDWLKYGITKTGEGWWFFSNRCGWLQMTDQVSKKHIEWVILMSAFFIKGTNVTDDDITNHNFENHQLSPIFTRIFANFSTRMRNYSLSFDQDRFITSLNLIHNNHIQNCKIILYPVTHGFCYDTKHSIHRCIINSDYTGCAYLTNYTLPLYTFYKYVTDNTFLQDRQKYIIQKGIIREMQILTLRFIKLLFGNITITWNNAISNTSRRNYDNFVEFVISCMGGYNNKNNFFVIFPDDHVRSNYMFIILTNFLRHSIRSFNCINDNRLNSNRLNSNRLNGIRLNDNQSNDNQSNDNQTNVRNLILDVSLLTFEMPQTLNYIKNICEGNYNFYGKNNIFFVKESHISNSPHKNVIKSIKLSYTPYLTDLKFFIQTDNDPITINNQIIGDVKKLLSTVDVTDTIETIEYRTETTNYLTQNDTVIANMLLSYLKLDKNYKHDGIDCCTIFS